MEFRYIPVELLDDHEENTIFRMDDGNLEHLAKAVKSRGILQPLLVRAKPDGRYRVIAGHRRKMAALLAGLKEVPCIVRYDDSEGGEADDEVDLVLANLHMRELKPMERARAHKVLYEHYRRKYSREGGDEEDKDFEGYLREIGLSKKTFYRYYKLNKLIPELQEYVNAGIVNVALGEKLASQPEEKQKLWYVILSENIGKLTVEEVMKLKEEADRGYMAFQVLMSQLKAAERELEERKKKEGEVTELERRIAVLRARIKELGYDLADRQAAMKALEEKMKKGGAALLSLVEKVGKPVAAAKPEIDALLGVSELDRSTAAQLVRWAEVLVEVGNAVLGAARAVLNRSEGKDKAKKSQQLAEVV